MTIENFLAKIPEKQKSLISRSPPLVSLPSGIPAPFHDLYLYSNGLDLPFGRLFNISQALKESARKPFNSKWFVFGKDNYFTYWLCALKPEDQNLWITTWDHGAGLGIDGELVWGSLEEFLIDELEEFIEG